MKKQNLFILF